MDYYISHAIFYIIGWGYGSVFVIEDSGWTGVEACHLGPMKAMELCLNNLIPNPWKSKIGH